MLRALIYMISGILLYLIASFFAANIMEFGVSIGDDYIPWGYFIFLSGSYAMGTSAAILQVVINPYVNAYDLPGTQPVQRMSIVCAINSFGTTIAPFFVTGVLFAGVSIVDVEASQLIVPFFILAVFISVVAIVSYCCPIKT